MKHSRKSRLQDEIFEYALGLMPEPEQSRFAGRIKKNPLLREQVFAVQRIHQEALERLPDPPEIPDFTKELLNRVRSARTGQRTEPGPVTRAYRIGLGVACVVLGALSIITARLWIVVKEQQSMADSLARELNQPDSTRIADGNQTRLVISSLTSPEAPLTATDRESNSEKQLMQLTVMSESIWHLVDLDSNQRSSLPEIPRGYILMDTENKRGYVAIDDLNNPGHYILHIWLKLSNHKEPVFAGILPRLNEDKGLLFFDFATVLNQFRSPTIEQIFVTEETSVNKSTPAGRVILRNS